MDNLITKADILEYRKCQSVEAAYGLLLLAGPGGFDGSYDEYTELLHCMDEEAKLDDQYR